MFFVIGKIGFFSWVIGDWVVVRMDGIVCIVLLLQVVVYICFSVILIILMIIYSFGVVFGVSVIVGVISIVFDVFDLI